MSLPSGYKQLEYIQSSGTQYINTGFKPNQNTKIELDVLSAEGKSSNIPYIFGAQDSNNYFVATWVLGYGNGMVTTGINLYDGEFHVVKVENGALYKDGSIIAQGTVSSFSIGVPIFLFAVNSSRQSTGFYGACKLRSCKIYDNGTLVRDFIPCKNASGVIGLWDDVNSAFYQNAGTGTFTAGPEIKGANKTLIDGTGYDVKAGKCLLGGTAYTLKKGRTLVGGTGYDISLLSGMPISELPVGSIVKIVVNGTLRDFLIVHQGLPSSLYDGSCNGTWLLMKDIYEQRQWNSYDMNKLESSTIYSYLNSTFLNLFDSNIKDAIKQVKIPYRKNGGSGGTNQSGANGLSCKIFLLSGYEVGYTTSDNQHFPQDGAKLSYFESGTGTSANNKRIAKLNGSASGWWLRSPYLTDYVWYVNSYGGYDGDYASRSHGILPALILSSDTLVSDDGTITT